MSADHAVDKLVMMANQMGRFFTPQRGVDTVGAITNHINRFWEPRMRIAIAAHLANGGAGLDAPVREAVSRLKEAKTPEKGLSA